MKHKQKKRAFPSLRKQVFLSCSAIVIICGLFMFYIIRFSEIQIKNVYFDKTLELLVKESEKLSGKLENLQGHILTLLSSPEFDEVRKRMNRPQQAKGDAATVSFFSSTFESLENSNSYVRQAFAVTPSKMYFSLANETLRKKENFEENAWRLLNDIEQPSMIYWGGSMDNLFYQTAGRVIPLVVTYRSSTAGTPVHIVVLLDETAIYSELSTGGLMGTNLIVDDRGNPITYVRDPVIQEILADEGTRGKIMSQTRTLKNIEFKHNRFFTVCCNVVGNTNWKLLGVATEEQLFGSLQSTKVTLMLVMLVMLLISFVCTLGISHAVTKPLYRLRDTMKVAAATHFDSYFSHKANDVIGDLSNSYNEMLDEIKRLISQLEEERENARISQLLKRRAELKALQAQINPHFLYNTLDSINWMAIDAGAEKISDMAVWLAELFRSGLKRGNELSELRDEITHVSNYLAIQKMRYGDKFEYEIDYPDELADSCFGIRLLLQPLVENAIYHGIKPAEGRRHIWIRIWREEKNLMMRVMDDGIGFPPGGMEEINRKLSAHVIVDKGGYGIFNVNERIYLYFGEGYGLRYSVEDGRTAANITIPQISQTEAMQYDQYSNR